MAERKRTTLDELLDDPMVQMVMARDQVRAEELRAMLERDMRRSDGKSAMLPAHVIACSQATNLCC